MYKTAHSLCDISVPSDCVHTNLRVSDTNETTSTISLLSVWSLCRSKGVEMGGWVAGWGHVSQWVIY